MNRLFWKICAVVLASAIGFTLSIMLSRPGNGPFFMDNCPTWLRFGGGFTLIIIVATLLVHVLTEKIDN